MGNAASVTASNRIGDGVAIVVALAAQIFVVRRVRRARVGVRIDDTTITASVKWRVPLGTLVVVAHAELLGRRFTIAKSIAVQVNSTDNRLVDAAVGVITVVDADDAVAVRVHGGRVGALAPAVVAQRPPAAAVGQRMLLAAFVRLAGVVTVVVVGALVLKDGHKEARAVRATLGAPIEANFVGVRQLAAFGVVETALRRWPPMVHTVTVANTFGSLTRPFRTLVRTTATKRTS